MRRAFRGREYGDPWIECRMDTFKTKGGGGKPDGRNSRFVVVDHVMANNIIAINGGFKIWTFPGCLPVTAGITGLTNGVNDLTIDGVQYTTGPGNAYFYPIGVPSEWQNSITRGPGGAGDDPFNSVKARIVAVKRRLIYTGSTFNNQGYIQVTPLPTGIASGTAITTATNTVSIRDPAGANASQASVGTAILNVDMNQVSVYTKESVTCRIEQGVEIISKQSGELHQLVPSWDNFPAIVVNSITAGAVGNNNLFCYTLPGATPTGNFTWLIADPTWVGEEITVSGATANAPFRLETALCVEYQLASNSPMVSMAKTNSDYRPSAIVRAHQMAQNLPVATPGASLIRSDPRR